MLIYNVVPVLISIINFPIVKHESYRNNFATVHFNVINQFIKELPQCRFTVQKFS